MPEEKTQASLMTVSNYSLGLKKGSRYTGNHNRWGKLALPERPNRIYVSYDDNEGSFLINLQEQG